MADAQDNLIRMLEEDPKLYKIINSKQHMLVLNKILEKSGDFSEINRKTRFNKDIILYNILDTLIQKELIKKIEVNTNSVYYITEKGKNIIALFEDAKKKFNLLG